MKCVRNRIINENSIVNTSWMHIYHANCLLTQCKKYLSKYQYPEDWPVKGWTKRLGPQEITRHLNSIDKIRYEAFSLLRSGQMNRLQIMWCYKCRLIFAKKKNKDQICTKCNEISYWFQDALKFLELGNVRTNLTESQNKERKRLDKMFIEDWKGVVERWR